MLCGGIDSNRICLPYRALAIGQNVPLPACPSTTCYGGHRPLPSCFATATSALIPQPLSTAPALRPDDPPFPDPLAQLASNEVHSPTHE